VFKSHMKTIYIDEYAPDDGIGLEDFERQESDEMAGKAGTTIRKRNSLAGGNLAKRTSLHGSKGSGGATTNEQRAMLLAVFKRYIVRVSSPDARSALMKRCTWFRFLLHCQLLGPSCDQQKPEEMTISFVSAAKFFTMFAETANDPPALTFSGWVNAAQGVLRSKGFFETSGQVNRAIFDIFLPRAQEILGITHEDARKAAMQSQKKDRDNGGRKSTFGRQQSISLGSSVARAPSMRANSFMSGSGSVFGLDEHLHEGQGGPDDDKTPLPWQRHLAEEEMCEPECLQLLHEYIYSLKSLFNHYSSRDVMARQVSEGSDGLAGGLSRTLSAETDTDNTMQVSPRTKKHISPEGLKTMLIELRFYPDFVQNFALQRHVFFTQARHNCDDLCFNAFVECLCRITFVYLNAYGNSQQKVAPTKHKTLWLLSQLEARLPQELKKLGGSDGSERGLDSLWMKNIFFDVSAAELDELVLAQTMADNPVEIKRNGSASGRDSLAISAERAMSVASDIHSLPASPRSLRGRFDS